MTKGRIGKCWRCKKEIQYKDKWHFEAYNYNNPNDIQNINPVKEHYDCLNPKKELFI